MFGEQRQIVIFVLTAEQSDFLPVNTNLVFTAGSSDGDSLCFNVVIIDNSIAELDESFTLTLSSLTPSILSVAGDGGQATVTIIDNEGMQLCLCASCATIIVNAMFVLV